MIPTAEQLVAEAAALLARCRAAGLTLATAESCTGGLIAATLTEVAGSSDVFDRAFVSYSDAAKTAMLGIDPEEIAAHGAVSEAVARRMAEGALAQSRADLAVGVTGIAGPQGGTTEKPVGRVHIAAANRAGRLIHERMDYGDVGRAVVRRATVADAFRMMGELMPAAGQNPLRRRIADSTSE